MRYFVKAYIAQNSKRAEILGGALRLTSWLHVDWGQTYVAAPHVTRDGAPCLHYGAFTVALFDYVDGLTAMDEPLPDLDWQRMATLLAALHRSADALPPTLPVERDVFGLAYRPKLLRLLERTDRTYRPHTQIARQVHQLLREEQADILATLRQLEETQTRGREKDIALVLTHGDPNLANIIKDRHGDLHLVDWSDVALAPAERDLIFFTGPRFELFLSAYVRANGQVVLHDDFFAFYLYHWILQEIADYGTRILASNPSGEELAYYWSEFQQYVPIRHQQVAASLRAVRDVMRRICGASCRATRSD
jgi:hypothetical protein